MQWTSRALAGVAIALAAALPAAAAPAAAAGAGADIRATLSADARQFADSILNARDHRGRPFAIVDKRQAQMFVFDGSGRLRGATPVLLGQAVGDDTAPEVGQHAQQGYVPPHMRTTPAGRFVAQPGTNHTGEHVIWVDYESAFAIHRLRPGRSYKVRAERLASSHVAGRRVSAGCVVVPVDFYEDVVQRWLGQGRSVVYVLPETAPIRHVFNSL
jgi:hypothetical protein